MHKVLRILDRDVASIRERYKNTFSDGIQRDGFDLMTYGVVKTRLALYPICNLSHFMSERFTRVCLPPMCVVATVLCRTHDRVCGPRCSHDDRGISQSTENIVNLDVKVRVGRSV